MKQTYNTHDVYAMVTELIEWEGFRVLNVYDIDSKTICIKFNTNKSEKKYIVIESGTKFYTLENFSATKDFPSSFCSKLRKHINNKRLESVTQVNLDRVIDLQFGTGELSYHIIGEFYASGNIIFTDHQYKILTLVHPYTYNILSCFSANLTNPINPTNEESIKIKVSVGQTYPFEYATTNVELSIETIKTMFEENLKSVIKKIKLKQFVSKLPIIKYSLNVLEHALKSNSIEPEQKISSDTKFEDIFESDERVNFFINTINHLFEIKKFTGYKTDDNIYPYAYSHLDLNNLTQYDNFMECSSLFWSTLKPIETKELVKKKNNDIKLSKQEKTIWNIEQQIKMMEQNMTLLNAQIDLLTTHAEYIQMVFKSIKICDYINHNQFNDDFFKIITIIPYKKSVRFELGGMKFELDYSTTVFAGREQLFVKIKKINSKLTNAMELLVKQKKILSESNKKNINITEEHGKNILTKYIIVGQSKTNWFEQFNWFYTSDGLLFVSGKTAEQNELLVKRYMEDSDIYVHSDSFGSGSGLIKNNFKLDIPESNPKSLIESGIFLIAHTKAWETGIGNSAYWVRPSQVSKTPESGEYVSKGSFIIRGQKNFIRVDRMELGFGIIFKIEGKEEFKGEVGKNEQIEYAIPILSTYSAMTHYKFKVKIIYGTQKIKKALQDVLSSFVVKTNLYEKEALKKISNDSIQKVLISKIRFIISK